jgi:ATP-binding cassette subfamily F protein 3
VIEFVHVSKAYGGQVLLRDESFRLLAGERAGFVGANGSGKSTLFDMIAGEAEPDGGRIERMKDIRIGYLRQQIPKGADETGLLEYVEKAAPDLEGLKSEMARLEERLGGGGGGEEESAILRRLGELQSRFEDMGGYGARARAASALTGLGFGEEDWERPMGSFSGGWKMRAELTRALMAEPDLLLLDEPSNYLDVPAVEWLKRRLGEFRGTLAMISHDRYLLESLCRVTMEVAGGRVTRYPGPYSWYAVEREKRRELAEARAANEARRREQIERFVERFRSKNTLATRVQSKIKMLERMERTEVPVAAAGGRGRIRLAPPPHCGREVWRCEGAGFRYGEGAWVFRHAEVAISRGDKVAVIGPNGAGKTTLLRMMAGQLSPMEGSCRWGHLVKPGYQNQETAMGWDGTLDCLGVMKAAAPDLAEGELRGILGGFGFSGKDVEKRTGVLSGGERIRLAFARLLARPPNLLLLDEPTTHLDVESREALQEALAGYPGTMAVVSHDVEFIRATAGRIVEVLPHGGGVRVFEGGYDGFREWQARAGGAESAEAAGGGDAAAVAAKEEKVARHQDRKRLKSEMRKAEKEMARLESEIAALEEEQGRLNEVLAAAGTEAGERAAAGRRLKEIAGELEGKYAAWERVGAERDGLAGELE